MADGFEAGSAWIPVRPDFQGFHKTIAQEFGKLAPMVQKMGQQMGEDFANAIRRGLGNDPISAPIQQDHQEQKKRAPKQGQEQGGAFAQGFRRSVTAALKTLPEAEITADSSDAQKEIQAVRAQLAALADKTVGVDIDAAQATGELKLLQMRLDELSEDADIDVRADTVQASTQLDAVLKKVRELTDAEVSVDADTDDAQAQLDATKEKVDDLDGDTARVDVDASAAVAGLGALTTAAAGVAALPIGATLTAGIASMVGPLGAATAGFGALAAVAAPAITEVSEVLELQEKAAEGGEEAIEAYQEALAEMSPDTRELMDNFVDLRDAFMSWSEELQPEVLPLFSQGMGILSDRMDGLTPLVTSAADGVGTLLDRLDAGLDSAVWQDFGAGMSELSGPAIVGLGTSLGNVATGFAGIVNAFLPYAPAMLEGLEGISGEFATWGAGLGDSEGFRSFIAYATENAPALGELVGGLGDLVMNLVEGLAPLGPIALGSFGVLVQVLGQLPPEAITALAVAITSVVLATKAWALGSLLLGKNAPLAQKGIKGIGTSLKAAFLSNPVGIIITALTSLVPLVMWAWSELEWFRSGVTKIWTSISSSASEMWTTHLQPVWEKLVAYVQTVIWPTVMQLWKEVFVPAFTAIGQVVSWVFSNVLVPLFKLYVKYVQNILIPVVLWLWKNVITPAFTAIAAVISWAWTTIIKPVFTALNEFILNVLVPTALWLWKNIIQPAWKGISLAIQIAWGMIKIVFAAIKWTLSNVIGPVFLWLYNTIIKPVWDRIKGAISTVWNWIRDKVFKPMDTGTGKLGSAFEKAKEVIEKAWDGIKKAARAPVKFLVESVYMGGIRPMWNKVAGIVGADELPKVTLPRGFKSGGVLPGYTPGRDVHHFVSPTGGRLALSGGETIFRPEVTRALGTRRVDAINRAARTGGTQGAARALTGQAFASGGIFGGSTDGVRMPDIPGLLVDLATKGASAFAGIGKWGDAIDVVVDPIKSALSAIGTKGIQGIPYMATDTARDKIVAWLDDNGIGGGDFTGLEVGAARGLPGRVVALARAAVGQYPEVPNGSNRNAITSWYGMHDQWCAMFITWLFAQAGSSGSLGRARRTAWTGDYYNSGMPRVQGARMPGDVLVYGRQHVNLSLGGRRTIGGNEGHNVRYSTSYPGSPAVFRPLWAPASRGYARGGVVPRDMLSTGMLRRIGRQDDRRNSIIPRFNSGGWIRGLPGDRNLLLGADGEFVVNATSARENSGLLEALNTGQSLRDILAASGHVGLTASQLHALQGLSGGGGGGSTVNAEVHLHNGEATVRQAFREIRYEANRLSLAGKYGGR
ncbi:hypothetical protein ABZ799_01295 [Nocardiopsis dassonvillei]|uniref:hypothetical protein n=1 Tax=Nocardiopsis dassonvillei TaxID=2014 RepID=UPI00340F5573